VVHSRGPNPTIKAVIFDFGGVITSSPFEAFAAYEETAGLPPGLIRLINSTNPDTNAWARFERSEIDRATFIEEFEAEGRALGHQVDGGRVLACLAGKLRPGMVHTLDRLAGDYRLGCITNNVSGDRGPDPDVLARFDVVIESSKVGLRKPDPAIYLMACEMLEISPDEAVYLDDLGINCKPARALGMTTIKVESEAQALAELEAVLSGERSRPDSP